MINEAIAALVFVSLIYINSIVHYAKEPKNSNGWLMLFNTGMVAFVVHHLLERMSL